MTIRYICEGLTGNSDCPPATDFNLKAVEGSGDLGAQHAASVPDGSLDLITHAWTTEANEPNSADWPDGDYVFQVRVATNQIDSYSLTINRVESSCLFDIQLAFSSAQTGTGTFTLTTNQDPSAGSAGDRFQCHFRSTLGGTMNKNVKLRTDILTPNDMWMDGAWAGTPPTRKRAMVCG